MESIIIKNPPLLKFPKLCVNCYSKDVEPFQIGTKYRTQAYIHNIILNIPVCKKCAELDSKSIKKRNYYFLSLFISIILSFWTIFIFSTIYPINFLISTLLLSIPLNFYLLMGMKSKYNFIDNIIKVKAYPKNKNVMPKLEIFHINKYYLEVLAEINETIIIRALIPNNLGKDAIEIQFHKDEQKEKKEKKERKINILN
ncbi:MAG: hypothetical protein ACTSWY_13425 [Promethearchaeota archaeon]